MTRPAGERQAAGMPSFLSLHSTISEINANGWDRLAGENAFATHGWLRTIEASCRAPLRSRYFTLHRNETLVATAVCYVCPVTREIETLDDMFFGRLAGVAHSVGVSFLPALVCGPLLGYGWHIGIEPELSETDADEARRLILEAMESEAEAQSLALSFVHVLDDERELKDLLTRCGYMPCRNAPAAVLDVTWSSFEEYMAALPSKRRREFRRQINRNHEAGNVIARLESGSGSEARLLQLLDHNTLKHNARLFPFGTRFFEVLESSLGQQARIFAAHKSGIVTAVSVMLVQADTAFPVAVGVDHNEAGDDYSYFQLAYNSLIAHAIDARIRRIYYGRGLSEVKVRRGCRLIDTWIYSRSSGARRLASAGWFAVASYWNRRKLSLEGRQSPIS